MNSSTYAGDADTAANQPNVRGKGKDRYAVLLFFTLGLIVAGCATKGDFVEKETYGQLTGKVKEQQSQLLSCKNQIDAVEKKVEEISRAFESLNVDVDSYKAKVKEVRQTIDKLDLRLGRKIYEQDKAITEGRESYLRVIEEEEKSLKARLSKVSAALEQLRKQPSKIEGGLSGSPPSPRQEKGETE